MDQANYAAVMLQIRQVLRKQGLAYSELAQMISVPESTLKKWFLAKDGSFSRIHRICKALHVPLSEILQSLEREQVRTFLMNEKQQTYFLQNSRAFAVFWLLVYERLDSVLVQERLRFSRAEFQKILLQLDRLKLLVLLPHDKIQLPKAMPVRWGLKGKFIQSLFTAWTKEIVRTCLQEEESSDLILQFFQLSADSEAELRADLLKLEEKYARRTIRELQTRGLERRQIRFLNALAMGSFV